MVGIYKITSPTGKVYIGQSWNIEKRWKKYKDYTCKAQIKLYASFKKHKVKSHIFEIVHELPNDITQKVLDNYEILYWELYILIGINMMNIKVPGLGGKGSKHRLETIELISRKQKESYQNPKRSRKHYVIEISQFSREGIFIRDWDSIQDAAKFYAVTNACIGNCIRDKNRKRALGFIWKKK